MGRYVRVLYDFNTVQSGEIDLRCRDIVKIIHQVDENWLCGDAFGKVGNFPSNFVEDVNVPVLGPNDHLYVSIKEFRAEEPTDLGFQRGELIVGHNAIDKNWWNGSIGPNRHGIFPITHVYHLEAGNTSSFTPSQPDLSSAAFGHTSHHSNKPIAKGVAIMDLKAQLSDELGFRKGDTIEIFEVVDGDFAVGECNGQRGSFPIDFVEIIEGNITVQKQEQKSKFRWWEEEKKSNKAQQNTNISYANNEINNSYQVEMCMPSVKIQTYVEPSFPDIESHNKTHLVNNTHKRMDSHGSYTQENTRSYDSELTAYGKTLFPFIAENANELTFMDNEIINLVQHIDEQWIEGELDGKRGIFPSSYIEIIVDCPWAQSPIENISENKGSVIQTFCDDIKPSSDNETISRDESFTESTVSSNFGAQQIISFPKDTYGRALYDFKSETPQDLALKEGDTVMLTQQMDEFWYEARHDDGRVGFCPIEYIEMIETSPTSIELQLKKDIKESNKTQVPEVNVMDHTPESQYVKPSLTKPKPAMKPKPHIAKKPEVTPSPKQILASTTVPIIPPRSIDKQKSEMPTPPAIPSRAFEQQNAINSVIPEIPSRENESKPIFKRSETLPLSNMQAKNQPPRNLTPTFATSSSLAGLDLDDIIHNELQDAKLKAESRSRANSTMSDKSRNSSTGSFSDTKQSSAAAADWSKWTSEDFNAQLQSPTTTNPSAGVKSPSEKRVAFSTFYSSSTSAADSTSLAARQRPAPDRPAQPPPKLTRQRSGSVKKAPPRPGAALTGIKDRSSRLVPQRPAPPRPGRKPQGDDLMAFSPDSEESTDMSDENAEIVADLEKRMTEIETDLRNFHNQKSELESVLQNEDCQADIDDCVANIQGLTEELQGLKSQLYSICPARQASDEAHEQQLTSQRQQAEAQREAQRQMVGKRRETRAKVIQEILQTERDYLQNISFCLHVFLSDDAPPCPPAVDLVTLFGNMTEVIELSQTLLNKLEDATAGKEFDDQIIGPCFVALKSDMKKVYAPYCRNHDDVIALLEKYEEIPEIEDFFNTILDKMRTKCTVFDIGSILIKPVQRILKYPLLLNELIKNTEEDHADKMHLLAAINCMTDVAAAINEFKRRKDLVKKYREDTDEKLSDKIGKLNIHSTKKKFFRLSQKMVGVQTVDEDFNREERKFKNLDNAVKTLVRDVVQYLEQLQDAVGGEEAVANDISDYYNENSRQKDIDQFCRVHNQIASRLYGQFRKEVEHQIIGPLNQLLVLFQAPHKLMKKRYDKLLDYENIQSRIRDLPEHAKKAAQAELQAAQQTYFAMNAQLLDELPTLYMLGVDVMNDCIARLISGQKRFYGASLEEMYQLLGIHMVLGDGNIVETFNVAHVQAVDRLSDLCFATKAFNPRIEDKKGKGRRSGETVGGGSQSDSQKQYVRQLYSPDKLYISTADYGGGLMMDLALPQGSLVGVIKEGDPMGDKDRWYIDNGAAKGFVPRRILSPAQDVHINPPCSGDTTAEDLLNLSTTPPQSNSPALNRSWSPSQMCGNMAPNSLIDASSLLHNNPLQPQSSLPAPQSTVNWSSNCSHTSPHQMDGQHLAVHTEVCPRSPVLGQSSGALHQQSTDIYQQLEEDLFSDRAEVNVQDQVDVNVNTNASGSLPEGEDLYEAQYSFEGRNELELDLEEGHYYRVLQTHDLDQNPEWWLVLNAAGKQGYVPANYLMKASE